MSTSLRSFSQIPALIRFMRFVSPDNVGNWGYYSTPTIDERLVGCPIPYTKVGNTLDVVSTIELQQLFSGGVGDWAGIVANDYIEVSSGTLIKDLGQTFNFTINGLLAVQWTLAQIVSGATTEGVPLDWTTIGRNIWVVTYNANKNNFNDNVQVARIG